MRLRNAMIPFVVSVVFLACAATASDCLCGGLGTVGSMNIHLEKDDDDPDDQTLWNLHAISQLRVTCSEGETSKCKICYYHLIEVWNPSEPDWETFDTDAGNTQPGLVKHACGTDQNFDLMETAVNMPSGGTKYKFTFFFKCSPDGSGCGSGGYTSAEDIYQMP